jgi:PAS domain S-box-containing protein
LVLAAAELLLLPFQNSLPTELLTFLGTGGITILIGIASWRASRRSFPYARMHWLCVTFVALLWSIHFAAGALALKLGPAKSDVSASWPTVLMGSFPFAIAFTLPLLLGEGDEKLGIGWLHALDIAQFGIIIFSAFLVFFYIPSFEFFSDAQRGHHLAGLHLMRDSFLALGYVYRGYRSRFPDLRRLHFRMAVFLAGYGFGPTLLSHATTAWHWPEVVASFVYDLPALFLLATAVSWQQSREPMYRGAERPNAGKTIAWTQVAALIMPVSVVVLASRIPSPYTRAGWIIVSASFACYAARQILMQRYQNQTLSSLAALEEKFSKAFKSSPAAISITRQSDGKIVDANDRWLELVRMTRDQVIGKTTVELGIFENSEARDKMVRALRRQGFVRGANVDFRLAGRRLDTLVSAEFIELGGEPLIIASILDVTDIKSLTQQLQHAQKMELVGSLAGGIAHDFNNLLTVISGYSALALTRKLDAESKEEILRIKEASARATALTRQLLAFSRRQVLQPNNISLNAVVASVEKLLKRTIGDNIQLITSLGSESGMVYADPVQIEQVVMNLAVNARDAMPQGGKLLFETKTLDLTVPYPERGFEIPPGRYVMLIVTDNGTGIRPEDLDRIFEPFFTTKVIGTGTGLGLSTVYGIVKQSGGYIWASSDLGLGTTFKVCLPRVDSPADAIRPAEPEPENLAGTETVLVVDDDRRVCELTAKILDQYGYQVITANSGEDAERRAGEFAKEIHLLVTDVVMSGTSGRELAEQLKAKRPGLKTIYMSGYPHVALSREQIIDLRGATLPKPFAPTELAREAKRALNS